MKGCGLGGSAPFFHFFEPTRWSRDVVARRRAKPTLGLVPQLEGPKKRGRASERAWELYSESEVIDLHTESFSWSRALGYDLSVRHDYWWNGALLVGQADFPRLKSGLVRGAIHSITANPLRPEEDREDSFAQHLALFESYAERSDVPIVTSVSAYRAHAATGRHIAFLGVQGANALPRNRQTRAKFLPRLMKVCLTHLSNNWVGRSSTLAKLNRSGALLSDEGRTLIEELEESSVLVDLAHLHPEAVAIALDVSSKNRPILVSHTAMNALHPHFRNLTDEHALAVAKRGGLLGIIFHSLYLGDGLFGGRVATLARHIAHAHRLVGEDHIALGTDWDGLICPPRDMRTCEELPTLVDALFDQGLSAGAIRKFLGANALRVLAEVRP